MMVVSNITSIQMPLKPNKTAIEAASKPKPVKLKKCPGCHKMFPLTKEFFSVDKSKSSGFKSPCKWCHRKKSKAYYDKTARKVYQKKKVTTTMEWSELG
jgi:hypothetical protein